MNQEVKRDKIISTEWKWCIDTEDTEIFLYSFGLVLWNSTINHMPQVKK